MISVKVEGPFGLDEPEELRQELGRETGLLWQLEPGPRKDTLSGGAALALLQTVLGAAVGAVAQAAAQVAVERAVDRWRGRRLDPPTVTVIVVRPPEDGDPDGSTALEEG
ncbi:hypothetical protein [Streptomyces sp. NPDC051677]|uniref:hypothetical protein n=1 Tax=Streptomyces sp. NPDC051677 TaxID=3365669 RepID=UPI0037D876BA